MTANITQTPAHNPIAHEKCLADLYGHWKKNELPAPVIAEEYDPDRVKITVYTDSDQDPTKTRPIDPKCPKSAQDRPKLDPESAQGDPRVPQGAPEVPQKFESAYNGLTAAVKQVYRSMCEDASLTHRGMESKLGLSKTTIRKATATLIKLGMIKRVGSTKGGHWEVIG